MNNADVPIWEKYTLTIEEASKYFRIGENKLRNDFYWFLLIFII